MSKAFIIAFAGAVVIIAFLIWTGFSSTKGNHLAPTGRIGKVRIQKVDDNVSFAVIDFNAENDSDRNMIVRAITVTIDDAEGTAVAARDIDAAFHAYPELGEQFNPVLRARDTIPAHQSVDRMVGFRFDLPFAKVQNRTRLTMKIEDVTGPVLELSK